MSRLKRRQPMQNTKSKILTTERKIKLNNDREFLHNRKL